MNRERLPALKPKEVLRALQRAGFLIHHIKGSHHILKHPARPHARITLAMHGTDLKPRTLHTIIEQSGLSIEEFISVCNLS